VVTWPWLTGASRGQPPFLADITASTTPATSIRAARVAPIHGVHLNGQYTQPAYTRAAQRSVPNSLSSVVPMSPPGTGFATMVDEPAGARER